MFGLNDEQTKQIDQLISQDNPVSAMRVYREMTGVSINQAIDAINERLEIVPLPPPPDPTEKAFQILAAISCPIIVIEATWDADTRSPYMIHLAAITEAASSQHPRFTSHGLCLITPRWVATQTPDYNFSQKTMVDVATELGTRLAASVNAEFYLVSETVDETRRWWDAHSA